VPSNNVLAPYNYGNKYTNEVKWNIKKKEKKRGRKKETKKGKWSRRRKEMKERRKLGSRRQRLINRINKEF
jgi:hypothetical protein